PSAKFLVALRHPCDAVLSNFMQNFAPNDAMGNMTMLGDTAKLYDRTMSLWELYRDTLNPRHMIVKYEDLVTYLEGTTKKIIKFMGVHFNKSMLNFPKTARERLIISTPSYKQVVQPLYTTSVKKWEHYKSYFGDALETLTGWAKRLGYHYGEDPAPVSLKK